MLKTALISLCLIVGLLSFMPWAEAVVLDQGLSEAGGSSGAGYKVTDNNLAITVGLIIRVVVSVLGVVFLILTLYAGILWMTSAGDAKQVDKAKSILISSVIGLIIALSAYAITNFVVDTLGSATEQQTLPSN